MLIHSHPDKMHRTKPAFPPWAANQFMKPVTSAVPFKEAESTWILQKTLIRCWILLPTTPRLMNCSEQVHSRNCRASEMLPSEVATLLALCFLPSYTWLLSGRASGTWFCPSGGIVCCGVIFFFPETQKKIKNHVRYGQIQNVGKSVRVLGTLQHFTFSKC